MTFAPSSVLSRGHRSLSPPGVRGSETRRGKAADGAPCPGLLEPSHVVRPQVGAKPGTFTALCGEAFACTSGACAVMCYSHNEQDLRLNGKLRPFSCCSLSACSRFLACGEHAGEGMGCGGTQVVVFDVRKNQQVKILRAHSRGTKLLAWSRQASKIYLLAASYPDPIRKDEEITIWSWPQGDRIASATFASGVRALSFAPEATVFGNAPVASASSSSSAPALAAPNGGGGGDSGGAAGGATARCGGGGVGGGGWGSALPSTNVGSAPVVGSAGAGSHSGFTASSSSSSSSSSSCSFAAISSSSEIKLWSLVVSAIGGSRKASMNTASFTHRVLHLGADATGIVQKGPRKVDPGIISISWGSESWLYFLLRSGRLIAKNLTDRSERYADFQESATSLLWSHRLCNLRPHSRGVLACGLVGGAVQILNAADFSPLASVRAPEHSPDVISLSFSVGGEALWVMYSDHLLRCWRGFEKLHPDRELEPPKPDPKFMGAARSGSSLVTGNDEGLDLWAVAAEGLQLERHQPLTAVTAVATCDHLVAVGYGSGDIQLLNLPHLRYFRVNFRPHRGDVSALQWLSLGRDQLLLLSVGSEDRVVRVSEILLEREEDGTVAALCTRLRFESAPHPGPKPLAQVLLAHADARRRGGSGGQNEGDVADTDAFEVDADDADDGGGEDENDDVGETVELGDSASNQHCRARRPRAPPLLCKVIAVLPTEKKVYIHDVPNDMVSVPLAHQRGVCQEALPLPLPLPSASALLGLCAHPKKAEAFMSFADRRIVQISSDGHQLAARRIVGLDQELLPPLRISGGHWQAGAMLAVPVVPVVKRSTTPSSIAQRSSGNGEVPPPYRKLDIYNEAPGRWAHSCKSLPSADPSGGILLLDIANNFQPLIKLVGYCKAPLNIVFLDAQRVCSSWPDGSMMLWKPTKAAESVPLSQPQLGTWPLQRAQAKQTAKKTLQQQQPQQQHQQHQQQQQQQQQHSLQSLQSAQSGSQSSYWQPLQSQSQRLRLSDRRRSLDNLVADPTKEKKSILGLPATRSYQPRLATARTRQATAGRSPTRTAVEKRPATLSPKRPDASIDQRSSRDSGLQEAVGPNGQQRLRKSRSPQTSRSQRLGLGEGPVHSGRKQPLRTSRGGSSDGKAPEGMIHSLFAANKENLPAWAQSCANSTCSGSVADAGYGRRSICLARYSVLDQAPQPLENPTTIASAWAEVRRTSLGLGRWARSSQVGSRVSSTSDLLGGKSAPPPQPTPTAPAPEELPIPVLTAPAIPTRKLSTTPTPTASASRRQRLPPMPTSPPPNRAPGSQPPRMDPKSPTWLPGSRGLSPPPQRYPRGSPSPRNALPLAGLDA